MMTMLEVRWIDSARSKLIKNPKACPDCGNELFLDTKRGALECWNLSCNVIEIRLHHRNNEIIRCAAL